MKALVLSAAAFVAGIAASPASAGVMTLGGPMSFDCYQAARGKTAKPYDFETCTRALSEEALGSRDRAATFVNRGILYARSGRRLAAFADYDSAIRAYPSLADAWLNKGFLFLREGDGSSALPLIEKGIALGSTRAALAHYARGIAKEQTGDFKSAYADFRRAQQLEPDWELPRLELARYQVRRGR